MINQQLLDFIKSQLLKGVDKETITKELLGSGWAEKDIQEGFNAINAPVVSSTINPVINPVTSTNMNNPILIQNINHSRKKILFIIVALFVIAGGALGYYFRNDIPVIKDLIKSKDLAPVNEIKQEKNTQTQIQQEETVIPQQEQNQDNNTNKESQPVMKTEDKKVTTAIATKTSIIDCGSDLSCFIKLANACQKTKVKVVKVNEPTPIFDVGIVNETMSIEITGKEASNCVSRIKITDYNFKYNEKGISLMLNQGNTQDDIKKEELDNSESMIGSGQICKIDSSKKTGEAISQLINSSDSLNMKCNNSICSYSNGLSCESFLKLNDNLNCKLEANVMGFGISNGVTSSVSVSGFNGKESQVSWSVKDKNIVYLSPLVGRSINVKSLNTGSTELIATDNSIGKDCFVTIPIKITD